MSPNEKKAVFGARQDVILAPKEGFEVESVEVFNKTTNMTVPCTLAKQSDNPLQWVCTFNQPAGAVIVRPKIRPIFYSVIIEECENCSVVLLESTDDVEIKILSPEDSVPENGAAEPQDATEAENEPAQTTNIIENANALDNVVGGAGAADSADGSSAAKGNGEAVNFKQPQHSVDVDKHPDDATDVEEEQIVEATEPTQDKLYDAGEFEDELQEVEPIVMSRKEYDQKCASYWQHRTAYNAGEISKEKYDEVYKKHMKLSEDISTGKVIIK